MSYTVKRYVANQRPSANTKDRSVFEMARPLRSPVVLTKQSNQHSMNELKNQIQNLKVQVHRYVSRTPMTSKYSQSQFKRFEHSAKNEPQKNEFLRNDFKDTIPFIPQPDNKLKKLNSLLINNPQTSTPNYSETKNATMVNHSSYRSTKDIGSDNEADFDYAESVTSSKLIDSPLRKLGLQASSQNYDHAEFLAMEVQLLKTELKNLKNKYIAKKEEMNEKINILEKKCNYLTASLKKSEHSLADHKELLEKEIAIIKSQMINGQQSIPQIRVQDTGNEVMDQKINALYEEIGKKNQKISELKTQLQTSLEDKTKTIVLLKMETERSAELSKEIEFTKLQESRMKQHFQSEMNKRKELINNVQKMKSNEDQIISEINKYQNILQIKEKQYRILEEVNKTLQIKETKLTSELSEAKSHLERHRQVQQTQCQQIHYLKKEQQEQYLKIQQLNKRIRECQNNLNEQQTQYRQSLEQQRRTHGEELQKLQAEYANVQVVYSPLPQRKEPTFQQIDETHLVELEKENKRWKAEYKLLKRKHQELVLQQKVFIAESAANYKSYVDYKQKYQVLKEKSGGWQESSNQYCDKLRTKQNELTRKNIDLKIFENEYKREIHRLERENNSSKQQVKQLNEKVTEERTQMEKQIAYRREVQAKIRNNLDNKEIIEKITKRLEEQDEKINKNLKEVKKKDAIIAELKQQVSQIIQNHTKIIQDQSKKDFNIFAQAYIQKQFDAIEILTKQTNKQKNSYQEQLNSMLQANTALKQQLLASKTEQNKIKDQLSNISHIYSQKCFQFDECKKQLQKIRTQYHSQIEELKKQKNQLQTMVFNIETIHKNEMLGLRVEINTLLRQSTRIDYHNFDDAMRSEIQLNKELKQQISRKNEELFRLRDSNTNYKTLYDNLKSEIQIIRLKALADKKNIEINYEVDKQNLTNKLSMQEQKVKSLQQKIKVVIDETKKKDTFIQNYIMGKKLSTDNQNIVRDFLKQYEISIGSNNVVQKIEIQTFQIKRLSQHNLNLLKEIASLKQKMLTYEAFEGQVSLFDERQFGKSPSVIEPSSPTPFTRSSSTLQYESHTRYIPLMSPLPLLKK